MRCLNCGENHWENVDAYRLKPAGMAVCTNCGFVSYPEKWKSYEEIKKHYRNSYRQPPAAGNLFTGQRKLHFHNSFLAPLFEEWKQKNKTKPSIFEIGAAYGLVLDWFRSIYPEATVRGTEWALTYKRVCKHEFGIQLEDDFDDTKKYDLIVSYKVAEHQLDVDKELRKYALSLTDDGYLYISIPTWFDMAQNFGLSGFDPNYYYDPNHVNCWTQPMFENLLARAGLEIVKKDDIIYDSTYLCKRNDSLMNTPVFKENPDDIKKRMSNMLEAFKEFSLGHYEKAIEIYPNYPSAHISKAEMKRKEAHEKGWEWTLKNIIEPAIEQCQKSVDVIVMAADLAMRAEKFKEAIMFAETSYKVKPENPVSLSQLANIMRELAIRSKDEKQKIHYFGQALQIAKHIKNISSQHFKEATDMIYGFSAELPYEGEQT